MRKKKRYINVYTVFNHIHPKLETIQIPTCGCINKLWYTNTMEFNSDMKRNKLLMYTETWMNLKYIKLSQMAMCHIIPLIWVSGKGKSLETDNGSVVARVWISGGKDRLQRGMKELLAMMEKFYILIVTVVTWLYKVARIHRAVHLKRVNFIVYKL